MDTIVIPSQKWCAVIIVHETTITGSTEDVSLIYGIQKVMPVSFEVVEEPEQVLFIEAMYFRFRSTTNTILPEKNRRSKLKQHILNNDFLDIVVEYEVLKYLFKLSQTEEL